MAATELDRRLFVIAMQTVVNSAAEEWEDFNMWGYGFIICLSCGHTWRGIFPDELGGAGLPCSACHQFAGQAVHG